MPAAEHCVKSTIVIPLSVWHRLADVIQNMGNHHPDFRGTDIGSDLDVLGNALKYGIPRYPGAPLSFEEMRWVERAEAVVDKHGGGRRDLLPAERFIEIAERLLGLWKAQGEQV